jgi:hypothetical protein
MSRYDPCSASDVAEFAESLGEAWNGDGFEAEAFALLEGAPIGLSGTEAEALVFWIALRDSASFFGRMILDSEGVVADAREAQAEIENHASEFGPLVSASCPASYFFETADNAADPEAMRLFRMVCAVRSLVGAKKVTGTTKAMLAARCIGAKSPAVAEALASMSEPVREELDALRSRKRFDRILAEGAIRNFYGKLGHGRRVYLSTTETDPKRLGALIDGKFNRQAAYRMREAEARAAVKGQQGGSKGGSKGGSFNKPLIKAWK